MPPAPLPHGPSSVATLLAARARRTPDAEALVDRHRRLSYEQLDVTVAGVAAGLHARGIAPGDRVAVSLPNSVDVVVAFLACMRLGAIFVGVHPSLTPRERGPLLDDAGAAVLLAATSPGRVAAHLGATQLLGIDLDGEGIADLVGEPLSSWPAIDPLAPAAYAYTSGTTGLPKAAVHDQHHVLLPAMVILHDRLRGRGERIGVHLPLTTLNVQILGPVLALLGGGTCICIDGHDAGALADTVRRERVQHLSTSPAIVHDLVEHPDVDTATIAGLRLGVGGVACPERLRARYRERFGAGFTTGYGLTEAPTAVTQETERVPHRAGASGIAMAHVTIETVDEDGTPLGTGLLGEIAVRPATSGPWAGCWAGMHGYHRRPADTSRALDGRGLRTGDTGWLDDGGYLHVEDRQHEVINRGGSKVSPAEVERILREHPAVADCIVLGRPDERLGATIVAAVQPPRGVDVSPGQLRDHCRRALSRHKVPERIEIVDVLPRNGMGKVVRADVLALFDETS